MQKIEEASRKKDEQTYQFISQTKEALDQKMETHTEKREAYITDLKTKLKVIYNFFILDWISIWKEINRILEKLTDKKFSRLIKIQTD